MIDGLGVAGWGVGGIEAEAAMHGQAMGGVGGRSVYFKVLLFLESSQMDIHFIYFLDLCEPWLKKIF